MLVLKFQRLSPEAHTPQKAMLQSAGWDLKSLEEKLVPARGRAIIRTGLMLEFAEGSYWRIAPSSEVTVNHELDVFAGVVDRDYTEEIKVILFNHSEQASQVSAGMKIDQIIMEQYEDCTLEEIKLNEEKTGALKGNKQ